MIDHGSAVPHPEGWGLQYTACVPLWLATGAQPLRNEGAVICYMLSVSWVSIMGVSQVAYQTPPFPQSGVGGRTSAELIK